MVWIDEAGVKINTAQDWDGNQKGYNDITVAGDLANKISTNDDGNICSTTPQWYLMVVTASVSGRDIKYTVEFNEPNVYLIGEAMGQTEYTELAEDCKFEVPTTMDADFVSPAFTGNTPDDAGVRAYVKIPGNDWWHSEFMVARAATRTAWQVRLARSSTSTSLQVRVASSKKMKFHKFRRFFCLRDLYKATFQH